MAKIKTGYGVAFIAAVTAVCAFIGHSYVAKAKEEFSAAEESMPESAISTYFAQVRKGDFDGIYEDSMIVSPHMNSQEDYVAKLEEIYDGVDTSDIEYTGLDNSDGSKDYKLYYNQKYLATLRLIQSDDGEWIASTIFSGDLDYRIEVPSGLTITCNGVEVTSDYLYAKDQYASNFEGLDSQSGVPTVDVYVLENMLGDPEIAVKGDSSYGTLEDVLTGTIYVGKTADTAELQQVFIDDAEILAKWPAADASLNQVTAISITNSDWYDRISGLQNYWFTDHTSYNFSNEKAWNIIQQSDDTMVGYVIYDYYATNGEVDRTWNVGYQITFMQENGTWKIAGMGVCSGLNPNKVVPGMTATSD